MINDINAWEVIKFSFLFALGFGLPLVAIQVIWEIFQLRGKARE